MTEVNFKEGFHGEELETKRKALIAQAIVDKTLKNDAFQELLKIIQGLPIHKKIVKLLNAFLTSTLKYERRFLSWEQAKTLYLSLSPTKDFSCAWRFQHILCSRVWDAWNIQESVMDDAYAYHYNVPPFDPLYNEEDGHRPTWTGCICRV